MPDELICAVCGKPLGTLARMRVKNSWVHVNQNNDQGKFTCASELQSGKRAGKGPTPAYGTGNPKPTK